MVCFRLHYSKLVTKKLGDSVTQKLYLKIQYYLEKIKIMKKHIISTLNNTDALLSTLIAYKSI